MPREWNIKPIPMTFSQNQFNKHIGDIFKTERDYLGALPFQGERRKDLQFQTQYRDLDTHQWVAGTMNVHEAIRQNMAAGYKRGYLSSNIASMQMVSDVMTPFGSDKGWDTYDDVESLKFTTHQKNLLQKYAEATRWNFAKGFEGFSNFDIGTGYGERSSNDPHSFALVMEAPEDLFFDEPPEGWTPEEALKDLKEANPRAMQGYLLAFDSEENIAELVKDSRNAVEFFYKLNNAMQTRAINTSMNKNFEDMGGMEKFYAQWLRGLVVHGIINDPDMLGSMAASALLAIPTGGLSLAGAGVLWATRGLKAGGAAKRLGTAVAQGLSKGAHIGKVRFLMPETIGPVLMGKMFKNYKHWGAGVGKAQAWNPFQQTWSYKRFGVNALGNSIEGFITGGLAETANQQYQLTYGLRKERDWGLILKEAALESAITPLINPTVGRFHNLVLTGGPKLGGMLIDKMTPESFNKNFENFIKRAQRNMQPEQLDAKINTSLNRDNIRNNMSTILGDPSVLVGEDDTSAAALTSLQTHLGNMDPDKFVNDLNTYVEDLALQQRNKEGVFKDRDTLFPEELATVLAGRFMANMPDGGKSIDMETFFAQTSKNVKIADYANTHRQEINQHIGKGKNHKPTFIETSKYLLDTNKLFEIESDQLITDTMEYLNIESREAFNALPIKETHAAAVEVVKKQWQNHIDELNKKKKKGKKTVKEVKDAVNEAGDITGKPVKGKPTTDENSEETPGELDPADLGFDADRSSIRPSHEIISAETTYNSDKDAYVTIVIFKNKAGHTIKANINTYVRDRWDSEAKKQITGREMRIDFSTLEGLEDTGSGDVFRVLNTIIGKALGLAEEHKSEWIYFTGMDEKRLEVYRKVFQRAFPDVAIQPTEDGFTVQVKDLDINGDGIVDEADFFGSAPVETETKTETETETETDVDTFEDFMQENHEAQENASKAVDHIKDHMNQLSDENTTSDMSTTEIAEKKTSLKKLLNDIKRLQKNLKEEELEWIELTGDTGEIRDLRDVWEKLNEKAQELKSPIFEQLNPLVDNYNLAQHGYQEFLSRFDVEGEVGIEVKRRDVTDGEIETIKALLEYVPDSNKNIINLVTEWVKTPTKAGAGKNRVLEIKYLKSLHTEAVAELRDRTDKILSSDEYTTYLDTQAEVHEAWKEYTVKKSETYLSSIRNKRMLMLELQSTQFMLEERNSLNTRLDVYRDTWSNILLTEPEVVRQGDLLDVLPPHSKWASEGISNRQIDEFDEDLEIPIKEAKKIARDSFNQEKERINSIQEGRIINMTFPIRPSKLRSSYVHNDPFDPMVTEFNTDWLQRNSTPGKHLGVAPSMKQSLVGLDQFQTNLWDFIEQGIWNTDEGISAKHIRSLYPPLWQKLDWAPTILFRDAIHEKHNIKATEDGTNLIGQEHTISFDPFQVMDIVEGYFLDGITYTSDQKKKLLTANLNELITQMSREDNTEGFFPPQRAMELSLTLHKAINPLLREKFKGKNGKQSNWVLTNDKVSGAPATLTKSQKEWQTRVKQEIEKSIADYFKKDSTKRYVQAIADELGILIDPETDGRIIPETLATGIIQAIPSITPNGWRSTSNSTGKDVQVWDLSHFGDGTIDWQSAEDIAPAFVDFFAHKHITSVQRKQSVLKYTDGSWAIDTGTEVNRVKGESTGVIPLMERQGNAIAIVPLAERALLIENHRARARWEFIAKIDGKDSDGNPLFTETEKAEMRQEFEENVRGYTNPIAAFNKEVGEVIATVGKLKKKERVASLVKAGFLAKERGVLNVANTDMPYVIANIRGMKTGFLRLDDKWWLFSYIGEDGIPAFPSFPNKPINDVHAAINELLDWSPKQNKNYITGKKTAAQVNEEMGLKIDKDTDLGDLSNNFIATLTDRFKAKLKPMEQLLLDNPIPVNDRMGALFFPWLLDTTLDTPLPTRDQMIDNALYYMLDLPNLAVSYIQDSATYSLGRRQRFSEEAATHLNIKEEAATRPGGYRELAPSEGDDFIRPAMEMMYLAAYEAYPSYQGITKTGFMLLKNHKHRWNEMQKQNKEINGKHVPEGRMYSRMNYVDRVASVFFEARLVQMGTNPYIKKWLDALNQKLVDETYKGEDLQAKLDDHYMDSGLFVTGLIFGHPTSQRTGDAAKFRDMRYDQIPTFKRIFEPIENIMDLDQFNAAREAAEDTTQFDLIRDFFKIPVLRTHYTGGVKAFIDEFTKSDGEGVAWLKNVKQKLGIEVSSAEVEVMANLLYKHSQEAQGILIEKAMDMSKADIEQFLQFLTIDLNSKAHQLTGRWADILRSIKGTEIDPDSPIISVQNFTQLLEDRIPLYAELIYGSDSDENIARVRERVEKNLEAAYKYLEETLEEDGSLSDLTDTQWNNLEDILHGVWEEDTGEFRPMVPSRDMDGFRAWNIKNTSHYKLNAQNLSAIAEAYNIKNWSPDWMLGLEEHMLYMVGASQVTSGREYRPYGLMPNDQGIRFSRAEINQEALNEFIGERKKELGSLWDADPRGKFNEAVLLFMSQDKDNRATLGAYSLIDSPMHKIYREAKADGKDGRQAVRDKIDHLLWLQELQTFSQYAPIPLKKYTVENSDLTLMTDLASNWIKDSDLRHETIFQEMQAELAAEHGDAAAEFMAGRDKMGHVITNKDGNAVSVYNKRNDWSRQEVMGDGSNVPLLTNSRVLEGPLSFAPKYTQYSFRNRGVLALEAAWFNRHLEERQERIGLLKETRSLISPHGDYLMPQNAMGYPSPWNYGSLPKPRPVVPDAINIALKRTNDTSLRRRVRAIFNDVTEYATNRGLAKELDSPQMWPFLLRMMKGEKALRNTLKYTSRVDNKKPNEIVALRERWLEDYHLIDQISRDLLEEENSIYKLESPGFEIPIVTPPGPQKLGDILRNVHHEDKPGILLAETLLHEQLQRSVPDDGVILDKDGKRHEVVFKATRMRSSVTQNKDFLRYLIKDVLTQAHAWELLRTWKDGKYANLVKPGSEKTDSFLDEIEVDDLAPLSQAILRSSDQTPLSMIFNVKFERYISKHAKPGEPAMFKASLESAKIARTGQFDPGSKTETEFKFKHMEGGRYGFWYMTGVPAHLEGQSAQVELSPEGTIKMLTSLSNFKLMHRLHMSKIIGRSFGVKEDAATNNLIEARPDSDIIKDQMGNSDVKAFRRSALEETEALNIIMGRNEAGEQLLSTITDEGGSYRGVKPTYANLSAYNRPVDSNSRLKLHPYLETHIGTVRGLLHRIHVTGREKLIVDNPVNKVETLIEQVYGKEGTHKDIAQDTLIALSVMINAAQGSAVNGVDAGTLSAFYQYPITNKIDSRIMAAQEKAEGLLRELSALTDADMRRWDNPYYGMARQYLWQSLHPETELAATEEGRFNEFFDWASTQTGEQGAISITDQAGTLLKELGLRRFRQQQELTHTQNWLRDKKNVIVVDIETTHNELNRNIVTVGTYDASTQTENYLSNGNQYLSKKQAGDLLKDLEAKQNAGMKVLTLNGNEFDFRVLGQIAGDMTLALRIAVRSVDAMAVIESLPSKAYNTKTGEAKGTTKRGQFRPSLKRLLEAINHKESKTLESGLMAYPLWLKANHGTKKTTTLKETKVNTEQQLRDAQKAGEEWILVNEDDKFYTHKTTGETRTRVTTAISGKITAGSALYSGQVVGTGIDAAVRDAFGAGLKSRTEYTTEDGKTIIFTEEAWAELTKGIESLKKRFKDNNETVIAENFTVFDETYAGTLDLITHDAEGRVRIYDVKGVRNLVAEPKKYDRDYYHGKHQKQLSMYAGMLTKTHGITVDGIEIIAFGTEWDKGTFETRKAELTEHGKDLLVQNTVELDDGSKFIAALYPDLELDAVDLQVSPDLSEADRKKINEMSSEEAAAELEKYTTTDARLTYEAIYGNDGLFDKKDIRIKSKKDEDNLAYEVTLDDGFIPNWLLNTRKDREYGGIPHSFRNWGNQVATLSSLTRNMVHSIGGDQQFNGDFTTRESLANMGFMEALSVNFDYDNSMPEIYLDKPAMMFKYGDVADGKSFGEWASLQPDMYSTHLQELGDWVNELAEGTKETKAWISKHDAILMRSTLARFYQANPNNVKDFKIAIADNKSKGQPVAGAIKTEEGQFEIRVGRKLLSAEEGAGGQIVFTLAHELGHIARLKWIDNHSAEFARWEELWSSTEGKALMKDLVQSWHGGVWNERTKSEYDNYTENVEEFLASITGYHFMESNLEIVRDMTQQQLTALEVTKPIIQAQMMYVQDKFERVADVFYAYREKNKEAIHNLDALLKKTRGWDPTTRRALTQGLAENVPVGELLPMKSRLIPLERDHTRTMSDADVLSVSDRLEALTELQEERGLTDEENAELRDLNQRLKIADSNKDGEAVKDQAGFTRSERLLRVREMREAFGIDNEGASDIDMAKYKTDYNGSNIATLDHKKALVAEFLAKMERDMGDQVTRGAGELFTAIGKMGRFIPGLDEHSVSKGMNELLIGNTGVNRTINAPWLPFVMLSSLLDESVANMQGNYTQIGGQTSIGKELDKLKAWSGSIIGLVSDIDTELMTMKEKILGGVSKEGPTADLLQEVWSVVMEAADNRAQKARVAKEVDMSEQEWISKFPDALQDTKVPALARQVADLFYAEMEWIVGTGKETGYFHSDFRSIVPYVLAGHHSGKADATKEGISNFFTDFSELVQDTLLNELKRSSGRVHAQTFWATKFLPAYHNRDIMLADLKNLQKQHPEVYTWVNQQLTKDTGYDDFIKPLEDNNEEVVSIVRKSVKRVLQNMGAGNVQWSQIASGSALAKAKAAYRKTIESKDSSALKGRLAGLSAKAGDFNMRSFFAGDIITPNFKFDSSSIANLITSNVIARSYNGQYFLNDDWAIPTPVEAANHSPIIRNQLNFHPSLLSEGLIRGVGDKVFEHAHIRQRFGVMGDYGDIITLFEDALPYMDWHNPDGTKMDAVGVKAMQKSLSQLRDKWHFIRNIMPDVETNSDLETMLFQIAPGLTRIGFGPNMALASYTVEGIGSALFELAGRKNISGFVRHVISPINHFDKKKQAWIGRDIAHNIQAFTRAFIPDYVTSPNQRMGAVASMINKMGNQTMRLAQGVHSSIAIERSITLRNLLVDLTKGDDNTGLNKLAKIIEEARVPSREGIELGISTRKERGETDFGEIPAMLDNKDFLFTAMREAGIDESNEAIIRTMLMNRLLEPGRFQKMKAMMRESINSNKNSLGVYSTSDMLARASQQGNLRNSTVLDEFSANLQIIQGLRSVEDSFIGDMMVMPNAFDVTTGQQGWLGYTLELFRRYPVLFVSQHIMRKSKTKNMVHWGAMITSLMLLDIVYMMALRMAMGTTPNEILEEFEEDPLAWLTKYGLRMPIFGRYGAFLAEGLQALGEGFSQQRTPGAFIPAAATISVVKNLFTLLTSGFSDDISAQDTINALRGIPIIGDSALRLAFYAAIGDGIERNKRKGSSSGRGGGVPQRHVGASMDQLEHNWASILNMIRLEALNTDPMQWDAYSRPQIFGGGMPQLPSVPQEAPEPPVQPSPEPTGVESLEEAARQPGGSELADRLID